MNFCPPLIKLVIECVMMPSFSLLIEGEAIDRFHNGCGLRQGDPLSSFLFNLLMEIYHRSGLHFAEKHEKPDTYIMGGVKSITHLLFVDEMMYYVLPRQT